MQTYLWPFRPIKYCMLLLVRMIVITTPWYRRATMHSSSGAAWWTRKSANGKLIAPLRPFYGYWNALSWSSRSLGGHCVYQHQHEHRSRFKRQWQIHKVEFSCDFTGGFEEVSAHESTCKFKFAQSPVAPQQIRMTPANVARKSDWKAGAIPLEMDDNHAPQNLWKPPFRHPHVKM